jgi:hercynylcysteine S-oxide lyase
VNFPVDDTVLEQLLRSTIQNVKLHGGNAKIAMFDTVVTFPGVRLPWERLVKACQDMEVLSLIDGAHGIGHIDLTHLASVGPDFFYQQLLQVSPFPLCPRIS